jgi:hypothetical protein
VALIDTVRGKDRIKSLSVDAGMIDAGNRLIGYSTFRRWQRCQINHTSLSQQSEAAA